MPAGTYSTYAKTIIQPVRKPPVCPSPRLPYVYSEPADGSRRANSAMLLAQHMAATNAISTTSGDANPAYDTTMTSPATTEPAGATLLAPNAITRADPTTPRASPPPSQLSVLMSRPPLDVHTGHGTMGTAAEPRGSCRARVSMCRVSSFLRFRVTTGGRSGLDPSGPAPAASCSARR